MARVGKGSPRNAPIVKGVQSVPPVGRNGKGRTGSTFGTTNQSSKTVTNTPTSPRKGS